MVALTDSVVRPLLLLARIGISGGSLVIRPQGYGVKVRITEKPREEELDGVRLDRLERGAIKEVSPSIGSWLIAEGYAAPEMRQGSNEENQDLGRYGSQIRATADDRPRRRSTD